MGRLSFYDLGSIKLYGVPVEIDSTKLTLTQAKVLVSLVEKLIDDAGHKKDVAVKIATEAFRRMYDRGDDGWRCRRSVRLKDHAGVVVPNKFYAADQKERVVGRVKAEVSEERQRRRESIRILNEAGARNSTGDKKAILTALDAIFGVLNKKDQDEVLQALHKKLGRPVTFKRSSK